MSTYTFDPKVGSGMVMTANGWVKRELVEAFIAAEALRLRTQEFPEVDHA